MKQKKSIANLVTDLQEENEKLQYLGKLFNNACKHEFGYDVSEIHQLIIIGTGYRQFEKSESRNPSEIIVTKSESQSSSPDSLDPSEEDISEALF